MARTIRVKVYKFNELNEQAKQKAIDNWRNESHEISWSDENADTLRRFADIFPCKLKSWCYGDRGEGVYWTFTGEDQIEELSGQRLATYIWNNYHNDIYKPKQYWIYQGRHNTVGQGAKHRDSKVSLYDEFACPLTGYCMDNEIIAPLFDFMRKPDTRDFKELLESCFDAWIDACNNDVEFQNSDEVISETLESNDYEFTQDGKRY